MRRLFGLRVGVIIAAAALLQGVAVPVAVAAPDAPSYTSSVYKTSGCAPEGCGGIGVEDTFLFSSTSADVVKFRWGFTEFPTDEVAVGVPVRWAPAEAGPKLLRVHAVDSAGASTLSTFSFFVRAPKPREAYWFGGDDPAFDGSGNGHDLVLSGLDVARAGRTVGGSPTVGFDGAAAGGATTAKVLDTTQGITVSAWVRLTDGAVDRTVVSQQGAVESAFRLGYDAGTRRWTFALAEKDAANSAQRTVRSKARAVTGVWTHLTGTYDDASGEVRLYVDGVVQEKVAVVEKGFAAEGELWIGKALRGSAATEAWHGELTEMLAWNRAITPREVRELAVVAGVGHWLFNDGNDTVAVDSTNYAHDMTLSGATWGPGVSSSGLRFDGGGSARTSDAVLYTDQSFTVNVWAKLDATGTPGTVVAQRGPSDVDPFALRYDGAQWSAEMPNAAVNPTKVWRAKGDAVAGKWTHLVATYDANARTLSLAVGYQDTPDVQKSTVARVAGWNSDGVLTVGTSFVGGIDELKALQGVVS
ncbi:LamG-like jellyroll fold domain-containing protein [Lentzea sp. NPDC051208]|uniref:LamG domain-containing protein n=1 Tax=Lentzea sp. NPDC051208 TaxID=3154642 RepID=UPI003424409F